MAHKQGAGSTRNNRDSISKRLGVKVYHNSSISKGEIIIRQHGFKYKLGTNIGLSKDYTIFSLINGFVKFNKNIISVSPYL